MSKMRTAGDGLLQLGGNGEPVVVATDEIDFTIAWSEDDREAMLIRLVDNDVAIELPGTGVRGRGALSVAYRTAAAAQHVIEWRTTFPGQTLTDVVAKARRPGVGWQQLKDADEVADVWASSEVLS